jgi:hypothetical protein
VATAAIAAELGENRDDLVREVDENFVLKTFYLGRDLARHTLLGSCDDRRFAVGQRGYQTGFVDLHDTGGRNFVLQFPGQVPKLSRRKLAAGDQLLPCIGAAQGKALLGAGASVDFHGSQLAGVAETGGMYLVFGCR